MVAVLAFALCWYADQDPPSLIDMYLKQLRSKDVEERREALKGLAFLYHKGADEPHEKIAGPLFKALRDPDAEVRRRAASMFCMFAQPYKPAIPVFAEMLRDDKDVGVRACAAYALLQFAPAAKDELPTLKAAKKHDDKFVRLYAGGAVARLEPEDADALQFVLKFLRDHDEGFPGSALGVITYLGVRTIPALKDGLNDKDPEVRRITVSAISATRRKISEDAKFPPDAIALLIKAIDDENADVAEDAIYAVGKLGPRGKGAIAALVRRLKDPKWVIRYRAINALAEIGSAAESAVPALKEALRDEQIQVRSEAEYALKAIGKAQEEAAKKEAPK